MDREQDLYMKRNIFGSLFVISNTLQTLMDRVLKEVGITSKQWLMLAVLGEFYKDQPPTLKEAATLMGTSHQNVKQIALKLEEKGFVVLEKDTVDKRIVRIRLQIKEGDFGKEFEKGAIGFLDDLFEELEPGELESLLKAHIKMSQKLKMMDEMIKD